MLHCLLLKDLLFLHQCSLNVIIERIKKNKTLCWIKSQKLLKSICKCKVEDFSPIVHLLKMILIWGEVSVFGWARKFEVRIESNSQMHYIFENVQNLISYQVKKNFTPLNHQTNTILGYICIFYSNLVDSICHNNLPLLFPLCVFTFLFCLCVYIRT
jgi:hypothetical protein